jgi:hypothetical protein
MKTKSTDQLLREIKRLKRDNRLLEVENKELKSHNALVKAMAEVTTRDLKEYIAKYNTSEKKRNQLIKDILRIYPTFTI